MALECPVTAQVLPWGWWNPRSVCEREQWKVEAIEIPAGRPAPFSSPGWVVYIFRAQGIVLIKVSLFSNLEIQICSKALHHENESMFSYVFAFALAGCYL